MDENNNTTKQEVQKISFGETFVKIIAVLMGIVITYTFLYISFNGRSVRYQKVSSENTNSVFANSFVTSQSAQSNSVSTDANPQQSPSQQVQNGEDNSSSVVDTSKVPQTTEEIIELYKSAHNKVKAQAKSVTKVYSNASNYNDVVETGNNVILARVAKSVMGTFMKENTEAETFEGSALIGEKFPPSNASCNLSASEVESAKCTDKGSYYEVEIHIKPEKDPVSGKGTGAVASIITKDEITDAVSGYVDISNIHCDYENVYVIANIDKATGNMTYEYVHMPMYLNLTALNMDCKVGILFEDKFEIKW